MGSASLSSVGSGLVLRPCRALILAPPTLDVIGDSARLGGPALYAGIAFRVLGVEVSAFGPVGWMVQPFTWLELKVGIGRLGELEPNCAGPVFRHKYHRGGLRTSVLAEPGCVFDIQMALEAVSIYAPDVVLLSPVWGEDPCFTLARAAANLAPLYLDIQGYARAGYHVECGSGLGARAIHVAREDASLVEALRIARIMGPVIYTLGEEGGSLLLGKEQTGLPRPQVTVDDPTGAGDVFTATVAALVECGGMDLAEAATLASQRLTGEILNQARSLLQGSR